jgi:5-hydroxyisourate hydrolase
MRRISTHVLDTARGRPAASVVVRLERADASGGWRQLSSLTTDQDGRCAELLPEQEPLTEGNYRLAFETADYFAAQGIAALYPRVEITFQVSRGESHFHLPLLLCPNGYTTYRGS